MLLPSSFNILTCAYLGENMKNFEELELNRNLIEEKDSSQCLKILSQY